MQPRISVIMGVYNVDTYLHQAIDSILTQSYPYFELIAVNDGSTDLSANILQEYAQKDSRVQIVENNPNHGHAYSLNRAISLAKGDYIARMDADDICLPNRFEVQIAFMDANPEIGVCGSWIEFFGNRAGVIWEYPLIDPGIRTRLLFNCSLAHPTVMIRKDILTRPGFEYREDFKCAEDYYLWVKLLDYTGFANIPLVLLKYRLHSEQLSSQKEDLQRQEALEARRLLLEKLNMPPSDIEEKIYGALDSPEFHPDRNLMALAEGWLQQLVQANLKYAYFPHEYLWNEVSDHWTILCDRSSAGRWWLFWKVLRSPLGYARSKSFLSRFYKIVNLKIIWRVKKILDFDQYFTDEHIS